MTRWLRTIVDVRRGEVAMALLMFAYYYLLLSTYYLLKPARDSLFLIKLGSHQLPFVYMLVAAIAVPLTALYGRAGRGLPLNRLINITAVVLIANLLALRWLLEFSNPVIYYAFYVWVSIYGVLTASQFWLLANAVFDAGQAKRLFVVFSMGGIVGSITGSGLTNVLVTRVHVPTRDLLFICAALLVLGIGLVDRVWRRLQREGAPVRRRSHERPRKDRVTDAFAIIKRSRHLSLIVGIIAASMAVTTFTDYQFKVLSAQSFTTEQTLTAFIGRFGFGVGIGALLAQLLLGYPILRRFGVTGSMFLLPVGLLAGSVGLIAVPGLAAVIMLVGTEDTLKYSIDRTARELLYLPVPLEIKKRVKVFIDIIVDRWFRGLAGAVLLLLINILNFGVRELAFVVCGLVLVWLVMAWFIRGEYIDAFRRALECREIDLDEATVQTIDRAGLASLREALASRNDRQVAYALDVIRDARVPSIHPSVVPLLEHPSAHIRLRALHALSRQADAPVRGDVEGRLHDDDPAVRRAAMQYVLDTAAEGRRARLGRFLTEGNMQVRATAVGCIAEGPPGDRVLVTREVIGSLMDAPPPDRTYARSQVAEIFGVLDDPGAWVWLETLLEDEDPAVVGAAIRSAGRIGNRAAFDRLIGFLRGTWRAEASRALSDFGSGYVGTMGDMIRDRAGDRATRIRLCRVLGRIPTQECVRTLLSALDTVETELRFYVIKALNSLRAHHGVLSFDSRPLGAALASESEWYYGILRALTAAAPTPTNTSASTLLRRALEEEKRASVERIFRLLGVVYTQQDIYGAYVGLTSGDKERRANAIEFLDNVLHRDVKRLVMPIVEDREPSGSGRPAATRARAFEGIFAGRDTWLKACVRFAARADGLSDLVRLDEAFVDDAYDRASDRGVTMLGIVERVIFLQNVDVFAEIPSEQLSHLAAIAEEVSFTAGEDIYQANDPSTALYIVLGGKIKLHRDGREFSTAGENESFGTWALFDDKPRVTAATAVEDTRTLCIYRDDFLDLLSDHSQIMEGVLKTLVTRLRKLADKISSVGGEGTRSTQ